MEIARCEDRVTSNGLGSFLHSRIQMAFSQHDSDTAATTVISAQNQRWPFLLCSKNISSFVAVWDPEYGMVAFSGTKIFDSRSCLTVESSQKLPTHAVDSLEEAHDDCRTSTFKIYQDVLKDTFRPTLNAPQRFRHNYSKTLASSTHGGLDLYTRDSVLVKDRQSIGPISCLNQLDNDLAFDARLAFSLEQSLEAECDSVCDEGFFDQGPGKDQTTHLVRPSSHIIYHGLSVQCRSPTSRLPPRLLLTTLKLLDLCRTSMGRA
jgi:hypothetical protein